MKRKAVWIRGEPTTYGQLPVDADYSLPGDDGHYNKAERSATVSPEEAKREDATAVIPLYYRKVM